MALVYPQEQAAQAAEPLSRMPPFSRPRRFDAVDVRI